MTPFDIQRIEEMEALYDALLQAVAEIEQGGAACSPRTGYRMTVCGTSSSRSMP